MPLSLHQLTRLRGSWPSLVVALVGLAATSGAFWAADRAEQRRIADLLELRVESRAKDIERSIESTTVPLEATAIFVSTQDGLDLEEFRRFAGQAQGLDDTIRTISWAPRVREEQRREFETDIRQSGLPGFLLYEQSDQGHPVPASTREEHYPVLAGVAHRNLPATRPIGFDYASEPNRRRIAAEARDSGRMIASPVIPTMTTANRQPVYIVFRPVYAGARTPADIGERRSRLRGFVIATFQPLAVLSAAIANTADIRAWVTFSLHTLDEPASGSAGGIVGTYSPIAGTIQADPADRTGIDLSRFNFVRNILVSGQVWRLEFAFPSDFIADIRSTAPYAWLVSGLLLTGFLVAYLERRRWQVALIQRSVDERTVDLRRSTTKLQALVDSSPLAIISIDPNYTVMTWSQAAERIFGYSADEVLGRRYALVPEGGWEEFDSLFARLAGGENMRDISVRRRHKDGRLLDIVFSGAVLHDESGKPAGAMYVLEDVTEKLKNEAKLAQAQKMEAVGQLTGGIAHDFNNILTVVVGNIDQMIETLPVLDADAAKARTALTAQADVAMTAALRGAELVRHLLAFSRNQPLLPTLLDTGRVVRNVEPLLHRALGEQISVVIRVPDGLWHVLADAGQFENAILNLAINARDAMPAGGTLTVAAANVTLDEAAAAAGDLPIGDFVTVTVSDTGTGIPPEVLARVFEPFFTTKAVGKGSGLGLSMVYGYARQSGGVVKIYSEQGHGTDVRIYLPRAKVDAPIDATAAPNDNAPARGSERILVVEDKAEVRQIAVRLLEDLGYTATEAEDAEAALALIDAGVAFDLLFTDLVMPGKLDGLALAREMRRRFPVLPIVFTSGFSEPSAIRNEVHALDASVIGKPYRKADLARHIRGVLDRAAD